MLTVFLLNFNWMTILLVGITVFFVIQNKAFSKSIRLYFQIALLLSLLLSILSQHIGFSDADSIDTVRTIVFAFEIVLRPIVAVLFAVLFLKLKRDSSDYAFLASALIIVVSAIASELILGDENVVNDSICIVFCVFYYYSFMQTYKKDNLTKLSLRHNLNYEMEDIYKKKYDIVLIDVDNFKLINDKYGHEKGDETLVEVVRAISKSIPRGCDFYRYGGDEFVIINRKTPRDVLVASLNKANEILNDKRLHFSYGISVHEPCEDNLEAIARADKEMYDNKNELKGDGVWDSLTGLFNYRGFLDEVEGFRRAVETRGHTLGLVAFDVDRLNNINMAYGYIEGNYVIKSVSTIIEEMVRGLGFAGHLGSDEFVVAVEISDEAYERLNILVEQIEQAMLVSDDFAKKDYTISLNAGKFVVEESNDASVEELINDVLYVKQEEKDNKHKNELNDSDKDYDAQEEQLVMDILDNNRLKYAFQPIVSAKDGEIVAYETLMRSDTDSPVSPLTILKYAERNRRSYDVEKFTFFNVFNRLTTSNDFPAGARIFINSIPGFALTDEDYIQLREQYGDWFNRMVVEITEQREVDDNALSIINVRRGYDGFELAIDDYGSGYSNTNSLLRYMPHVIKLDRLLITGIDRNAKKQFFVNSIISFARDNGMKILAEGVETENELKTVIRLGVDMIQGYFTARPSLDIVDSIAGDIKKLIVEENIKAGDNQRKTYTASENCELSSVRLAMDNYTKVIAATEYITIVGSSEYTADLVIRVKDNTNCHMTLSDVKLNSVDDEPCIDIGENSHLILNLEGYNRLNMKGIHVPEGSSLTVIGRGDLEIFTKGHNCYGIGADSESTFGYIEMGGSGAIGINVDGEWCTCIGGGTAGSNSGIEIKSGNFNLHVAGVYAIGIGAHRGDINIIAHEFGLRTDFRVNSGIVIGTLDGVQNIDITNFWTVIDGSGTKVAGIGSIHKTSGKVKLHAGNYKIKLNGQKLHILGCPEGELDIKASHVKFEMIGEGDNVIGFGSFDDVSHLSTTECSVDLVINASCPKGFGVVEEDVGFRGFNTAVKINGIEEIIGERFS